MRNKRFGLDCWFGVLRGFVFAVVVVAVLCAFYAAGSIVARNIWGEDDFSYPTTSNPIIEQEWWIEYDQEKHSRNN